MSKSSARLSGEVPLYSQILDVIPTGDFISLAMQDRKVVSFLIVDSNRPQESQAKIKNLPRKLKKFLNKFNSNYLID